MQRSNRLWGASALLLIVAFATTGCATKKFVRQQTGAVSARVEELDKKQTEALANLDQKLGKDISRTEERAMGAEGKAADAARAAQVADTKAGEATQLAKAAGDAAHQAQSQAGELNEALVNMDNFSLLASADVLFGFNWRTLTDEGKSKLDQIVQQAARQRRYVVEVAGYTDHRGPSSYNLVLSRDRADAVARYLVEGGVPLRQVRLLGFGEASAAVETAQLKPREMRRVAVRLYAPAGKLWAANEASVAKDASRR